MDDASDLKPRLVAAEDGSDDKPFSSLVPAIIGAVLMMQTLNATVLANALPTMARSLREDPVHLNTAIAVYLLASAVFLPISGWAGRRPCPPWGSSWPRASASAWRRACCGCLWRMPILVSWTPPPSRLPSSPSALSPWFRRCSSWVCRRTPVRVFTACADVPSRTLSSET